MSVATYAQFGGENVGLYREYLRVFAYAEAIRCGDWGVGRGVGRGYSEFVEKFGKQIGAAGVFGQVEALDERRNERGMSVVVVSANESGRKQEGLVCSGVKTVIDSCGDDVGDGLGAVGVFPVGVVSVVDGQVESAVSPKTLLNRERRKVAKERKLRKQEVQKKVEEVPEWRRKFASGELADSWAARKVRENKVAILKADEQIKRLESGATKPRLQLKVLSEAEQEAKIRADYEKHMRKTEADIAYWKKRTEAGAVEKAIKLEMEIMDGQISGKYDPFASGGTIGWAKTVRSNGSSSSGRKTVWSGSGASSKTDPSERVLVENRGKVMEKYRIENEKLRAEVEKLGKAGARLVRILKKKNAEGFDDGEYSFEY